MYIQINIDIWASQHQENALAQAPHLFHYQHTNIQVFISYYYYIIISVTINQSMHHT
jgi:hypothetical protein